MAITLNTSSAVFAAYRALSVMRLMQATNTAAQAAEAARKTETAAQHTSQSVRKLDVKV